MPPKFISLVLLREIKRVGESARASAAGPAMASCGWNPLRGFPPLPSVGAFSAFRCALPGAKTGLRPVFTTCSSPAPSVVNIKRSDYRISRPRRISCNHCALPPARRAGRVRGQSPSPAKPHPRQARRAGRNPTDSPCSPGLRPSAGYTPSQSHLLPRVARHQTRIGARRAAFCTLAVCRACRNLPHPEYPATQ